MGVRVDGAVVARFEQIRVTLSERVAHFSEQCAQIAVAVVAEPEADGVECVAEYARAGLQPDGAAVKGDARVCELPAYPREQIGSVACAVVARSQAQWPQPVDAQPPAI